MLDHSAIAFLNSDGSGIKFPEIFEPFRNTGAPIRYLAWSPDGRYLAFDGANETYSCGPNTGDCFTTNYGTFLLDYSRGKIIKHIEGTLTNPSWAPDSQRLVLSVGVKQPLSWGEADIGDLFIFDVRGGQMIRLTDHPYNDLYPAWSPDGQWIAFVRFNPDIPGCSTNPLIYTLDKPCHQASLYVVHPDGSDLRLLSEPIHIEAPVGFRDVDQAYNTPAWSPDSQWLAVLMGNEQLPLWPRMQEIVLVSLATGEVRFLTQNGDKDIYPTWSPDGRRLAFVSDREGNEEIYVMSAEGTDIVNLTQSPADEYAPAWSPSGQRIAFLSNRGVDKHYKLYIVNADGTQPVLVNDSYVFTRSRPAWLPGGLP